MCNNICINPTAFWLVLKRSSAVIFEAVLWVVFVGFAT